jgi:DNA-binding NarL/FixJ family response regulator
MRDLLVTIMGDEPDVQVVAIIEDESQILRMVEESSPEFLITTLESPGSPETLCEFLLRRYPHMKIVALAPDGNSVMFYSASVGINKTALECSETGILKALRANTRMALGG